MVSEFRSMKKALQHIKRGELPCRAPQQKRRCVGMFMASLGATRAPADEGASYAVRKVLTKLPCNRLGIYGGATYICQKARAHLGFGALGLLLLVPLHTISF